MKIPKEFEDSPFEYIEYLEQENEKLIELLKDLVSLGVSFSPYWKDRIEQALKQK
jgi:hypothetical protein